MQAFWITPRPTPYKTVWQAMQAATAARGPESPDEIWLTEHEPVYTLGQAGKREHLLAPASIPVVATDRGGQVTYHGPGQLVAYVLFDLRRAGYFVKEYVHRLESAIIATLDILGVSQATRYPGAPGVYVPLVPDSDPESAPITHFAKVAALGVKIRNGCTYHGISLNLAMDLQPFMGINPCGYAGLVTQDLASLGLNVPLETAAEELARQIQSALLNIPPEQATALNAPRPLGSLASLSADP